MARILLLCVNLCEGESAKRSHCPERGIAFAGMYFPLMLLCGVGASAVVQYVLCVHACVRNHQRSVLCAQTPPTTKHRLYLFGPTVCST